MTGGMSGTWITLVYVYVYVYVSNKIKTKALMGISAF